MRRLLPIAVLVLVPSWGQQKTPAKPAPDSKQQKAKPDPQEQEPPEEDEGLKPKEYSFNPLEAERDLRVGNYYFKKGNLKGALSRFTEATLWNPAYADAYLRLGDTQEKMKDKDAARVSYAKYLELQPDGKLAEAVRKKLGSQK